MCIVGGCCYASAAKFCDYSFDRFCGRDHRGIIEISPSTPFPSGLIILFVDTGLRAEAVEAEGLLVQKLCISATGQS